MVFVVIDEEVDYFGPVLQGLAGTDEEILFVENVQDLVLELLHKNRFFLK